ncbi:MAG: hypothetical protein FWC76_06920 [Defluviitaleaceae bacterium]|nr:hypothetical protein [Defluviitaleaceae bacterium]
MSNENKIYEITQMMSNNQIIKGDVNQAADMIKAMLSEKYIKPITKAVAAENKRVKKNPTREARLLDALKPFIDYRSHETVNKTIDMLHMMETLRGLSSQMPKNEYKPLRHMGGGVAAASGDASLHDDGVYDVDERCAGHKNTPNLAPIFAIMALACLSQ